MAAPGGPLIDLCDPVVFWPPLDLLVAARFLMADGYESPRKRSMSRASMRKRSWPGRSVIHLLSLCGLESCFFERSRACAMDVLLRSWLNSLSPLVSENLGVPPLCGGCRRIRFLCLEPISLSCRVSTAKSGGVFSVLSSVSCDYPDPPPQEGCFQRQLFGVPILLARRL